MDDDDLMIGFDDFDDDDEDEDLESIKQDQPTSDDVYLKFYCRLVYNLKKLMESCEPIEENASNSASGGGGPVKKSLRDELNEADANDTILSTATTTTTNTNKSDHLNVNNDQPLYCMKIIVLYSQLSQFRPDYWTLVNGQNTAAIRRIFVRIKKLLATVKDSINCLFQVNKNISKNKQLGYSNNLFFK